MQKTDRSFSNPEEVQDLTASGWRNIGLGDHKTPSKPPEQVDEKESQEKSEGEGPQEQPEEASLETLRSQKEKPKKKVVKYVKFEVKRDTPMGKCISRDRLINISTPKVSSPPLGHYSPRFIDSDRSVKIHPVRKKSKKKLRSQRIRKVNQV